MFVVRIDNNKLFFDNLGNNVILRVDVYDYFTRAKRHIYNTTNIYNILLPQGAYILRCFYKNSNKITLEFSEYLCIQNACIICGKHDAQYSIKNHHNIAFHHPCFYKHKTHIFDFCSHELGAHVLEHGDINDVVDIGSLYIQNIINDNKIKPFFCELIDLSVCKNALKIFKKNDIQLDDNCLFLHGETYMRTYNHDFNVININEIQDAKIINFSPFLLDTINKDYYYAFSCIMKCMDIIHNIYIIFSNRFLNMRIQNILIDSNIIIIL